MPITDGESDDAHGGVYPSVDEVGDRVDNATLTDEEAVDGAQFCSDSTPTATASATAPASGPQTRRPKGATATAPTPTTRCIPLLKSCGSTADAPLIVPTCHSTLQEAVEAAAIRAMVGVEPGPHAWLAAHEPITLASFDGPDETTIDGGAVQRGIPLLYAPGSLIHGFTVQNGYATSGGASISRSVSDDRIGHDVTFSAHVADTQGAAVQEDHHSGLPRW